MRNAQRKTTYIVFTVVLLIAAAILCRMLRYTAYGHALGMVRSFVYLGLFFAWGVSVNRRIIQVQARRYLFAVSMLMVFWIMIRSIKYNLIFDTFFPVLTQTLWYLFYLPMLFIPLMAVFVSLSLGKPEDYRLPGWTKLLYIPTALLLLLVLTNDLHELVFAFPIPELKWSGSGYTYGTAYYFVIGWELVCALGAVTLMLMKSRVPGSRRFQMLPLITISVALIYGIFYTSGAKWLFVVAGDMSAAFCLLFAATLESCIQSGLIHSNSGYESIFNYSTIRAQITDRDYLVRYASANAHTLPPETLRLTESGAVRLDRNTLLKGSDIPAGHVIWAEDVTRLADAVEQLEENRKKLEQANAVEKENYETKRILARLRGENRLYDLLQERTASQMALLDELLDEYYLSGDEMERRTLLAKAAVIGAFIKRRGNLVLLGERQDTLSIRELYLSIEESVQNIELLDVKCGLSMGLEGTLAVEDTTRIYDFFESAVEAALDGLNALWVSVGERAGELFARIEVITSAELYSLGGSDAVVRRQPDGVWSLALSFRKGGGSQ